MSVHKRRMGNFSFSHNLEFELNLLESLKQGMSYELSETEIRSIHAAKGQDCLPACPLCKEECKEGSVSCMNCTDTDCKGRKE